VATTCKKQESITSTRKGKLIYIGKSRNIKAN
jgi:hypothetical protein